MEPDPQKVAEEFKVKTILKGRIDNTFIETELIDVDNLSQLWGERYDRKSMSQLSITEDIQIKITDKLRLRLTDKDKKLLVKRDTRNPEAHRLYTLGRHHMNKRTQEDFQKGIHYFEQSINRDPGYALAYSGLADCYALSGTWCWEEPNKVYPLAKDAALEAIRLDPESAEAHTSLANVAFYYEWDWEKAEIEYKRAIELNPGYANAHHWYGEYLTIMMRFDEAILEKNHALELEPFEPYFNVGVALPYLYKGNYDEAINLLQKALDLDPYFYTTHFWLGWAYIYQTQYDEAIRTFQKAAGLSDQIAEHCLYSLCIAYSFSGRREDALRVLEQMKEIAKQRFVSSMAFVWAYVGLGEKEKAIEYLQAAYKERNTTILYIGIDPNLNDLRLDPRFKDILHSLNLPEK